MGVNSRASLDPRWTRHNVPVVAGYMLATIKVLRKAPNDGQISFNFSSGDYSNSGVTTVLTGTKARIQPFGIIGDMVVGQDPTSRRLMRVQIENVSTGINVDDMIVVTDCPDNPELKGITLEVRGTVASSNAWVTDIVAEADTKRQSV